MNNALVSSAIKGAVAGAIGVWAMDRFDGFARRLEPAAARRRTGEPRPNGRDPAHAGANRVTRIARQELAPYQPHPFGIATHYGFGIAPATFYAAAQDHYPLLSTGRGTLFGLGLFLTQDEGINAVADLSGKPADYPWQTHARGLASYLVFGLVTDSVLRVFDGHWPHGQYYH